MHLRLDLPVEAMAGQVALDPDLSGMPRLRIWVGQKTAN